MHLSWTLFCLTTVASAIPVRRALRPRNFIVPSSTVRISEDEHSRQEPSICRSKHCYEIARRIVQSRNMAVDPCTDFYEHACGSWAIHNPIPNTEIEWSEDHLVTLKTYSRIRDLLEEKDKPTDIEPIKMARRFYRSCMDVDAIEREGINPLLRVLNKTGGWPMAMSLHAWHTKNIHWQDVDKYYITIIGNSAFFNLEYEHNENDTTQNILSLDMDISHPLSSKKEQQILPFDFNDSYMNAILKAAVMFGRAQHFALNKRILSQDIIDMVLFELDLGGIVEEERQKRKLTMDHVTMTIKELQEWYDASGVDSPIAKIDFVEIIRYIFKKGNINIDPSQPIVVYSPNCLRKLAKLLGKTRDRVIVNYIQWNVIHNLAFYANKEMQDLKYEIYFSQYDVSEAPSRWETCVSLLEMRDALSYLFVKKYFADSTFEPVLEMMNDIQDELEAGIMRSKWIEPEMKTFMVGKLKNMVKQIGYPSWYKNDTELIELYKGLKIGQSFFTNVLNSFEHYLQANLEAFTTKPDRQTEWLEYPMTVNAFYSETANAIVIPAAELQDPYFTEDLPDAVNYGAVGFVVGHEMSHCFDNDGIQHDKNGNKISWISEDILEAYGNRATCFVEQFGNYSLGTTDKWGEPLQIDGEMTEDENIADSTGIQAAFFAYQKAKQRRRKVTKLPSLEHLSDDKLFFLSFATAWCETAKPTFLEASMADDDHSPAKYRVIGSLSNTKEFAQTFNCPLNSPMNRQDKCSLW